MWVRNGEEYRERKSKNEDGRGWNRDNERDGRIKGGLGG